MNMAEYLETETESQGTKNSVMRLPEVKFQLLVLKGLNTSRLNPK